MDFSIIESLEEENIINMYDDKVMNTEDTYLSECSCLTPEGVGARVDNVYAIAFGGNYETSCFDWWQCSPGASGYCWLKLFTVDDCARWCTSKGFSHANSYLIHYNYNCFCRYYRSIQQWYNNCPR